MDELSLTDLSFAAYTALISPECPEFRGIVDLDKGEVTDTAGRRLAVIVSKNGPSTKSLDLRARAINGRLYLGVARRRNGPIRVLFRLLQKVERGA